MNQKKERLIVGKNIVVTGELAHFPEFGRYPERKEFRELVERHGGKLVSSVSDQTDYLVCNDADAVTGKLRQARQKNIPIISEKEFLSLLGYEELEETSWTRKDCRRGGPGGFGIKNGCLYRYNGLGSDVVIPEGVTDIASDTFRMCRFLSRVTLPKTLKCIGARAFADCDHLETITLPEGLVEIDMDAFRWCNKLSSVTIPASVKRIGWGAFEECKGLVSVTIAEGVSKIEGYAFSGCENLRTLSIPEGVIDIEAGAFEGCKHLASQEGFGICNGFLFGYYGPGGDVVIPEGVRIIDINAFRECNHLESVVIPEGVTTIRDNAFWGCRNLHSVVLPKSMTEIGRGAFAGCKKLSTVVMPKGVAMIRDSAFRDCESLTNIAIPQSAKSIDRHAFYGCNGLADQDGFVIIKRNLFCYAGAGGDVVIPQGVNTIGSCAFEGHAGIASVTIPESVRTVGLRAFHQCQELKTVRILGKNTKIEEDAFGGKHGPMPIYFFAPGKTFQELKKHNLHVAGTIAYLCEPDAYADSVVVEEYKKYAISQKKNLVIDILEQDWVEGIATYAANGQITKTNFDSVFLQPAQKAGATQCVAWLLNWKNEQNTFQRK
jgi:hypothetical protein